MAEAKTPTFSTIVGSKTTQILVRLTLRLSINVQEESYELKLFNLFLGISFQKEHVCTETTQLIYTVNHLIGFYIVVAEIEIPQKTLFV